MVVQGLSSPPADFQFHSSSIEHADPTFVLSLTGSSSRCQPMDQFDGRFWGQFPSGETKRKQIFHPENCMKKDQTTKCHLRNNLDQPAEQLPPLRLDNIGVLRSKLEASSNGKATKENIDWLYVPGTETNRSAQKILRLKVRDLIQQENCDNNFQYTVDQPSRLVRIDCLKPGCRCVLKQESALALKIVCNISLVRGIWSNNSSRSASNISYNSGCEGPQLDQFQNFHNFNSSKSSNGSTQQAFTTANDQIPLILTSCSPFWFELLKKSSMGPNDFTHSHGPAIHPWTSGKAIWKSKPQIFLLLKPARCIISTNGSSAYEHELQSDSSVSLNLDNILNLHSGTVLRLINCKVCRLASVRNSLSCPPTASMLQCEVVGGRSLANYASIAANLPADDALATFSTGPRLVYLPLDDKSVSFCAIAVPPPSTRETRLSSWPFTGAHNILSLLSNFQLPISVRPLIDNSLANWPSSTQAIKDESACLTLSSCYHGDLVFLEPVSDCVEQGAQRADANHSHSSSRFFVVTTEMLSQHRFLLATPTSTQAYTKELKMHASRVAHFLAALHPAFGLNYLLKYLEDATDCSSLGPYHRAVSETLGPPSEATAASHTAVASIAASTTLHNADPDFDSHPLSYMSKPPRSGRSTEFEDPKAQHLQTIYDEIDTIYQYVRTGRFPKSCSLFSNKHESSVIEASPVLTGRVGCTAPTPTSTCVPADPLQMHIRLSSQRRSAATSVSKDPHHSNYTSKSPSKDMQNRIKYVYNLTEKYERQIEKLVGRNSAGGSTGESQYPSPGRTRGRQPLGRDYCIPYLLPARIDHVIGGASFSTTETHGGTNSVNEQDLMLGRVPLLNTSRVRVNPSPVESGFFQPEEMSNRHFVRWRQATDTSTCSGFPLPDQLRAEARKRYPQLLFKNDISYSSSKSPARAAHGYQDASILFQQLANVRRSSANGDSHYASANGNSNFSQVPGEPGTSRAPRYPEVRFETQQSRVCPSQTVNCSNQTANFVFRSPVVNSFRTIEQLCPSPAKPSGSNQHYSFLASANERVNSSPDTGLGGDSGQSSVAPTHAAVQAAPDLFKNTNLVDERNFGPMSALRRLNPVTMNLTKRIM